MRTEPRQERMSFSQVTLGVACFLFAFLATAAVTAQAHSVSTYYVSQRWASDPTMYRGYLTGTLNTDAARIAMYRGDDSWDGVSGSTLDFTDSSYQNPMVLWVSNACLVPNNGVWFTETSTSNFAVSQRCYSGSNIIKAAIAFDSTGRTWYTGTGTPPSGQTDLWGVSTHELGHAGGFTGHFSGSTDCPSTSAKQTMCDSWSNAQIPWARSLATHDEHTVASAY